MNAEIANRLVQLRRQHNFSQEELAEKLGISRQAVSKWERAEASPDTDNLISLARLYKVSLDDLLKTDEEPETSTNKNSPDNEKTDSRKERKAGWMFKFPYPVVAVIIFFLIGYVFGRFQYAWLIFLTIPVYYGIATAIHKKAEQ